MGPRTALLLLALLAALVAGCGGDDDSDDGGDGEAVGSETFERDGFELTFRYPSDFEERDDIEFSQSAGSGASETAGIGLDETNVIAVQRFDLQNEVTEDNLARVQREADDLFSQLAGQPVEGEETRVAGLPALEYTIELQSPEDAETRAIAIFDGDVQYLLNCQSTPESRNRIAAACDLAVQTAEVP